ncbi:huntingtin-interacting protein K [Exaiptasia diaphana]|uniref:Nascent polypeptide-associated complex subunit alpha-like UBA domain-containing protein n=1 Tax=Exaiptasia diaphana TaxID=2652724 RepID=A0A913Y0R3_EXADI|nr:huntingtin-interacting protein K [Exaiptasia diaphana]KXJ23487.1 Huntingtin-interacting protein K [Exaiptasia diaphana]
MAEQPAHKRHDLYTSADLERVTDYAEETEVQGDIESALNLVEGRHLKEKADQALREKELARVVIKKEDVDLIVEEMEIPRTAAERTLREHKGDVVQALVYLTN